VIFTLVYLIVRAVLRPGGFQGTRRHLKRAGGAEILTPLCPACPPGYG
jgi:hypothetical protein